MHILKILQESLSDRGTAIIIVTEPQKAQAGVIYYVNTAFASICGYSVETMTGVRIEPLLQNICTDADWTLITRALREAAPLNLDIELSVAERRTWFGFSMTFKDDIASGVSYGIIVGKDITQARRIANQEGATRRLLSRVFQRTEAPVAVIDGNGKLMMTNPAFQKLFGYHPGEIENFNIETLVAEEFKRATKTAREKQILDGKWYQIHLDMLAKDGGRRHVTATSVYLVEADQRIRVVTLTPDQEFDALPTPDPSGITSGRVSRKPNAGQVEVISLSAFKVIFGPRWVRFSIRAMLLAEQIINRRLGTDDVVNRCGDDEFIIWFGNADKDANTVILADIVREVRLQLVANFGEAASSHMKAIVA